jgi:hypothetical protein
MSCIGAAVTTKNSHTSDSCGRNETAEGMQCEVEAGRGRSSNQAEVAKLVSLRLDEKAGSQESARNCRGKAEPSGGDGTALGF